MGFLDRLLGRSEPSSRDIAKERLQLVLVHDRTKISPAMLDKMKDELITVISRYVEIDPDGVEVTFTQSKRENRLVADIPVVGPAGRSRPAKVTASTGARGVAKRSWRNFDYLLLGTLLVLSAYGVVMIYSATINTLGVENPVQRQIIYVALGLVLLLVTASLDYRLLEVVQHPFTVLHPLFWVWAAWA